MSNQKKNPRHEVVQYMFALRDERMKLAVAHCELIDRQAADMEFMQSFAEALGLYTEAPDWWELTIEQQRQKLIDRATMLRARKR